MNIGRSRILQSAKYLEQKRKKNIIAVSLISISIIIIILLIIFIFRLDSLKIKKIEFSGVMSAEINNLKSVVQGSIDGNYIGIVPRSNILFYSKDKIKTNLIESFKMIDTIDIKSTGLSAILISIKERKPKAIICDGFKDDISTISDDVKCYKIDEDGYIYGETNISDTDEYLHFYTTSDSNIKIGESFIDSEKIKGISQLTQDIQALGIKIKGILLTDDGSYELYFINSDQSTTVVYFDDKVPFSKTSSNFTTFWQASKGKSFEYINLKFGNNIFYTDKK